MTSAEINRAIAEQVMGASAVPTGVSAPFNVPHCRVQGNGVVLIAFGYKAPFLYRDWNPAESIADAMEAVEKWTNGGHDRHYHLDNWGAVIPYRYQATLHEQGSVVAKSGNCETLPQAIYLALLEAVKGKP